MPTFATSDGVGIRYEVRGEGPPVYVLQGGPNNNCDTMVRELRPLEDRVRLVFHDYRGSGRSASAPPATYRFERLVDDLDELRRHLGDGSIGIIAHSMGGFIALSYALRHPGSCDRLALVGTTPCGKTAPMLLPILRALGPRRTAKAIVAAVRARDLYGAMNTTQEPRAELRSLVAAAHRDLLPSQSDNAGPLMAQVGGLDLRDRLAEIRCPALVLYGSRDAVMVAGGQMLAAGLPQAEVVVLDDVGHEPFIEAPAESFTLLRRFLRSG